MFNPLQFLIKSFHVEVGGRARLGAERSEWNEGVGRARLEVEKDVYHEEVHKRKYQKKSA